VTVKKQKLELTWIGKERRHKLEPRILLENSEKSYHAAHRVSENDIFDNRLIFGDNLLALKALEAEFTGKVKCVFIDPPYNTGSAFTHYDDGLEHSIWLSMMRDRLEIIRKLLSEDGSLWITIDDSEAHYLKVLCDEIFGRANFIANVVWQKKSSSQANSTWLSDSHDHILVFAKKKEIWRPNLLPRSEKQNSIYKNSDEFDGIKPDGSYYGRGPWFPGDLTISLTTGQRGKQFAKTGISQNLYPIITPSGREVMPASGRCWAYTKDSFENLKADKRITFGTQGNNKPCIKRFLLEVQDSKIVCMTTWHYTEVGENRIAAQEAKNFNLDIPFSTPKPELLIKRILDLGTQPGDLVLDSFAGSGTTGAVAHKMGRRWIMIELGDHCHTHIIPRLQKVINSKDNGGITEVAKWEGGGGFRYYHLAPSLLEQDKWGNWVINKTYNAEMLTQALCKLEGFTYNPSDTFYWNHGYSTERDFIYVTTQTLNPDQLEQLSEEVGLDHTLLVLCSAFRGKSDKFLNLTVRKIPRQVLDRCEWGHDDYSLKVENLPQAPAKPGQQTLFDLENLE